jgi:hypothetical protein
MKKLLLLPLILLIAVAGDAAAQCAMCRSTLENNFSNGDPGVAAGMNTGILYLLALPYVAVMIIGYFWYKSTRNAA